MTITIETPPDVEQKVTQAADREGLSIEAYTLRALLTQAEAVPASLPDAYRSDPWLQPIDDWERLLLMIAADHEGLSEPISHEALRRENLYIRP